MGWEQQQLTLTMSSSSRFEHLYCVVGVFLKAYALERRSTNFLPVGLALGQFATIETQTFEPFTLNDETPVATLDYGIEQAGYAFFEVSNLSQPVQIEVRYSEPFAGLNDPWSDGPFLFSPMLASGFRAETFNVTKLGRFVAPLVQGGQRWQSITLLTGGSISFDSVGFEATVEDTAVSDLPGTFDSSEDIFNQVWKLGVVAVSTACVEKGSQGAVWEVESDKGVLVRSTKPAVTLESINYADYTLEFDTNIARGGIWWNIASTERNQAIQLMLVSDLPEETTFVNTNRTLLQSNTVLLAYGFNFVNQSLVRSYFLDYFPVPFAVNEGIWYNLSTSLWQNGHLSVSVNQEQIFNVSLSSYFVGGTINTNGTFGFGGWQDQSAYIRNVAVSDTATGAALYSNSMTSPDVMAEYGTQANVGSVCVDGPKRDRMVWLGDFYHTARIISTSTSRNDLSRGTLQFLVDTQAENGELSINPPLGYDPANTFTTPGDLVDYQFLGLASFHSYVQHSNDLPFVADTWPRWQKSVTFLLSCINETDGLVHVPVAFLGPPDGGSAVSCLAVQALRGLAQIAKALNDTVSQQTWTSAADSLADAINAQLWDDAQGAYILSPADRSNFSVSSTAFCITSGVADPTRAERSLAAAEAHLRLYPGYRDSTAANASTAQISPNTNGLLLDALLTTAGATAAANGSSSDSSAKAAGLAGTAGALLRSLWGAMLGNATTATGASWEYVSQAGAPGLGLFTSLAHPWGGAATYVLTERVLGLRPADGVEGFGYGSWIVDVSAGVLLGLSRASGRVVSEFGGLAASWVVEEGESDGKVLRCEVTAPVGTVGTFVYLGRSIRLDGNTTYSVSIDL